MPSATHSRLTRLDVLLLTLLACEFSACSESNPDSGATNGGSATTGGSQAIGGSTSSTTSASSSSTTGGSRASTGGTSASTTRASSAGGTSASTTRTSSSGGVDGTQAGGATAKTDQSCIPASQDGPPDHASSGYESQPCSDCHHDVLRGGLVYDASGKTVAEATVTITPTGGTRLQAVTGSQGMFVFRETLSAPYVACVSKCPDTLCSKASDHASTDDCGTCHGVTTNKIHLP